MASRLWGAVPGRAVLTAILPPGVESEECFGDLPGGFLFPAEERAMAHAVEGRRREFATVRCLARACLGRLGFPGVPLMSGPGGAPSWPTDVRGSMTHCAGYAGAAVGRSELISAIGIDAEPDAPLPEELMELVATRTEQARLRDTAYAPGSPRWDRLLFCAKEAVFKAWFPLVGEWLEFEDAEIRFGPRPGAFTADLRRDGLTVGGRPVTRLDGRWVRDRGILQTAVVVA